MNLSSKPRLSAPLFLHLGSLFTATQAVLVLCEAKWGVFPRQSTSSTTKVERMSSLARQTSRGSAYVMNWIKELQKQTHCFKMDKRYNFSFLRLLFHMSLNITFQPKLKISFFMQVPQKLFPLFYFCPQKVSVLHPRSNRICIYW